MPKTARQSTRSERHVCARTPNLKRDYSSAQALASIGARPSTIHRLSGVSKEAAKGIYTTVTGNPPPRGKLGLIHQCDSDQMDALLLYYGIWNALVYEPEEVTRLVAAFMIYRSRAEARHLPNLCPDLAIQMVRYLNNGAWYLVHCSGVGCGVPLLVPVGQNGTRPRRVKCALCSNLS